MNAFANALFTLLLGWARSLVYSLFSILSTDQSKGALAWLGDHWLGIVILLALVGTAVDFIVWLVRWQPYLVWRTRLRRLGERFRGETLHDRHFEKGYREGVPLERELQAPPPVQPEMPEQRFTRVTNLPDTAPPEQPAPVWTRVVSSAPPPPPKQTPLAQMMFEEEFVSRPQPQTRQKRRSDRYKQGLAGAVYAMKSRLNDSEEEEEEMLDGLPPVVDKEQAFHEPVYPKYNNDKRGAQ